MTQPKQHAVVERRHREAAAEALRWEPIQSSFVMRWIDSDGADIGGFRQECTRLAQTAQLAADAEAGLLREEPGPSREAAKETK